MELTDDSSVQLSPAMMFSSPTAAPRYVPPSLLQFQQGIAALATIGDITLLGFIHFIPLLEYIRNSFPVHRHDQKGPGHRRIRQLGRRVCHSTSTSAYVKY